MNESERKEIVDAVLREGALAALAVDQALDEMAGIIRASRDAAEELAASLRAMREALERIQRRAAPGHRTMGGMMDDLMWIDDKTRRALRLEGQEEKR